MTREGKAQLVSRVVRELLATDESIEVTIKRHPLEEPHEYDSEFASQARVTTVSGTDIIDLIGTCDIFVTQVSTAAFFAVAAGRPVVTFDLGGPPIFDLLQRGGIGVHVRNEGELRRAILEIINNPSIPKQSTREMAALESYSRTDGAATAAVASLVERLVGKRRNPGKMTAGDFKIQHAGGTAPRREAGGRTG
jgi:CDP-glycerol glycerophosphotransferase (TagB/SpsB family)